MTIFHHPCFPDHFCPDTGSLSGPLARHCTPLPSLQCTFCHRHSQQTCFSFSLLHTLAACGALHIAAVCDHGADRQAQPHAVPGWHGDGAGHEEQEGARGHQLEVQGGHASQVRGFLGGGG